MIFAELFADESAVPIDEVRRLVTEQWSWPEEEGWDVYAWQVYNGRLQVRLARPAGPQGLDERVVEVAP